MLTVKDFIWKSAKLGF